MLEVKFWPNKDTSNGVLGGGYIVTGIFKFSYKVRQGQYGPWVILPNVKKADGSGYTNLVDFVKRMQKIRLKLLSKLQCLHMLHLQQHNKVLLHQHKVVLQLHKPVSQRHCAGMFQVQLQTLFK